MLLRAASLLCSSLVSLQSSPPAGRRDRAAGLASPGRPGSASPLGRPAELAELVWDHFGVQNGIVGHQIMIL